MMKMYDRMTCLEKLFLKIEALLSVLDYAQNRPVIEEDFAVITVAATLTQLLSPHGKHKIGLVQGKWAELTDVCGCIYIEKVMPQLNLAAITDDFLMELEESPDTAPTVQTEAAEPGNEEEVTENEEFEPPANQEEANVPSSAPHLPNDLPQQSSQIALGPDRGILVNGSRNLVRIRFPGCFTKRRVYCLQDPQLNLMWMTTAMTEPFTAQSQYRD